MPSDRESEQPSRLLGEPGPDQGYGPWPRDWSQGEAVDDERALRELREGLVRGRIGGGARWEVPVRAAVAASILAFAVVAVVAGLLLHSTGGEDGLTMGEPVPLVRTSGPAPLDSATPAVPEGVSPAGSVAAPQPAVTDTAAQYRVYVVGQVRSPGVVSLRPDARVQDAIEAAGGATRRAALARINLARKVVDGERILVPKPGQRVPEEPAVGGSSGAAAGGGGAGSGVGSGAAGTAGGVPVDLNTATETELDALPGVGPVLAGRIVEWRQANGRFTTVDDLNEVSGIGDATMEKLRPLVRV